MHWTSYLLISQWAEISQWAGIEHLVGSLADAVFASLFNYRSELPFEVP
jgi:hypothetical protein